MLSAPLFSQIRLLVDSLSSSKKDSQSSLAELERVRTDGNCCVASNGGKRGASNEATVMISSVTNGLEFLNLFKAVETTLVCLSRLKPPTLPPKFSDPQALAPAPINQD